MHSVPSRFNNAPNNVERKCNVYLNNVILNGCFIVWALLKSMRRCLEMC
jgi:hypothetical protein